MSQSQSFRPERVNSQLLKREKSKTKILEMLELYKELYRKNFPFANKLNTKEIKYIDGLKSKQQNVKKNQSQKKQKI